ncbi:MAG TPA: hypothetical protein VFX57_06045 [Sulfuricurvum sp.]|nr:hypothetical protein [Sulfuricurvum sp.]
MKTVTLTSIILCAALQAATNTINTPMTLPATGNVTILEPKNDKELAWVDEQIKAIIPARIGISDGFINSLNDPIKYVGSASRAPSTQKSSLLAPPRLGSLPMMPTMPKVVVEPLRLYALMNKSALINGKWYRLNDSVRNFTLSEIKSNSVLLTGKKDQKLILFITKQNNNIKIITK